MDNFVKIGKEFLEQQVSGSGSGAGNNSGSGAGYNSGSGAGYNSGSGAGYNSQENSQLPPGNKAYGGNYPAGGDFGHEDEELRTAHQQAQQYAGSSGSSELFSNIINSISQKKNRLAEDDIDEQDAIRKHKQTYDEDADNLDSGSLGSAAALQALKKFTQGETGGNQSQGAFLGLAMSEASKLFDSKAASGKVSSEASKESAIQQAGELALKMYFKSQGGGQQQGPSGLLGLASKFL